MAKPQVFSIPALKRLPAYLRELKKLQAAGRLHATSPVLARALRIDAISVRKDLEMIGAAGSPGVGYQVEPLIDALESFLGWKNASEAFLVGTGHLGAARLPRLRGLRAQNHRGLRQGTGSERYARSRCAGLRLR